MAFAIYKSGQGRYVRIGTYIGTVLVDAVVCWYVYLKLEQYLPQAKPGEETSGIELAKVYLEYGIPFVLFAAMAVLEWFYLNKPVAVDFMIATESEMKKVSWSSRAELFGSTMVVIATVFLLAIAIYLVDMVFNIILGPKVLGLW